MKTLDQAQSQDHRLKEWCDSIVRSGTAAQSLTIGLTSGNRYSNDARVIFRIVKALSNSLVENRGESSMLLCRLNVQSIPWGMLGSADNQDESEARIEKSALGCWDYVEIPIKIGKEAPKNLKQIPRWLPKWKLRYHTVVVDLGPIHQVPSRTIGRICDTNFVVLGPYSCASARWISQYVDFHLDCGSHIAGTIVASAAA